jgi:hypothetical protein
MADRFLREVQRMHQLRQDINEMTPEARRPAARFVGDHTAHNPVHEKAGGIEDVRITTGSISP